MDRHDNRIGRLMLSLPGGLAEFERDPIRARTGEGREPRLPPALLLKTDFAETIGEHEVEGGRGARAGWPTPTRDFRAVAPDSGGILGGPRAGCPLAVVASSRLWAAAA